jgi:two-component system sensor histidine kinase SenX3
MMKEDVRRLTGFVESILEAGRLAHETEPLALEQVDVRALVAECIQRIRRQHALPSTAIDFVEQQLAQNPVYTDPRALETIVINLLDNAVKYSFDRIAITVTLTATEDWLRLAIHDQGVGIPPGRTRRIFERFYRLAENARRVRGTGLGLYIALALARRLGGAIEVHSAGAGFGSTFTVSLPTMAADIPRALPSPEEVSLEQQAPTRRG